MTTTDPEAGPVPQDLAIPMPRPVVQDLALVVLLFVGITVCLLWLTNTQMAMLSAVRAYVGGEALWSKAQKDAVQHLVRYVDSRDPRDYLRYEDAIGVTFGDRRARLELEKPAPDMRVVAEGFVTGRNHPDDVDAMATLFRRFRHASYIADAADAWADADAEVERLDVVARAVHADVVANRPIDAPRILRKIATINARVTPHEDRFSSVLGEGARGVRRLSLWITLGAAGLLTAMAALLSWTMLQRLRESSDRYRRLLDTATDAIVVADAETGLIVDANRRAEELTGRTREQLVGRPQIELHPAVEHGRYREVFEDRVHFQTTTADDLHLLTRSADLVSVEISAGRTTLGGRPVIQSLLRDVRERRRIQNELVQSRVQLEEVARVASGLVRVGQEMLSSLDTPVLLERLCQLTAELLGSDASCTLLRRADGYEIVAAQGPSCVTLRRRATALLMDTAFVVPTSTVRTLATGDLLFVLRHGEHVIGAQVVSAPRDGEGLTPERERIAAGIGHVASMTLENARLVAELEETSRLKTEFVSTMSHELRTPLNIILGYVEMARDADGPLDTAACMDRIETSGRELLGLIEHTLEVGRIEAGRDEARMERVALGPLWRTIGAGCERLPRKPAVALEWSDAGDVVLETDPRKLTIVVRNLVGNALKFTERGSVAADVTLGERSVVLRVRDTGIGIATGEQATVFEMFRQAAGPEDRRGSGLGLYIVRRFVEQMGGAIALESAPGVGSTFTVTLPRPVSTTSCAA